MELRTGNGSVFRPIQIRIILSKFERIFKRLHRLQVKIPRSQSRRRRSARPKHRKRFLQRPVDTKSRRSARGAAAGSACPAVFYNHEVSGYRRHEQSTRNHPPHIGRSRNIRTPCLGSSIQTTYYNGTVSSSTASCSNRAWHERSTTDY